jgi:cytochrome c-type biogenesis protein
VASFSTVFVLLGLSATTIGSFLFQNQLTLRKLAGGAIVLMGVLFVASLFVTRLNADWRPRRLIERAGRGGPVVAGLAFAIAWTPCVGPALGAILGLASTGESSAEGAALLAVYSAGLAVPFLLTAVGFNAARRSFAWVKRHFAAIQVGAGLVLVGMGVLVFTNELFRLNIEIQQALDGLGLNFFQDI